MSAEAAMIVRTFPVGDRTVVFTVQASGRGRLPNMTTEWHPTVPECLLSAS
jgi:hypothetical protein